MHFLELIGAVAVTLGALAAGLFVLASVSSYNR
jgi:hypothetical protein